MAKTRSKPELTRAKKIIKRMTSRGARRSSAVQAAVLRSGISLRTYRTARKQMGTVAIRRSRRGSSRGRGTWFAKAR